MLQAESHLAKDNVSLGEFELTNIQAATRGIPRVEVTFTIDTDGIVNVSAKDVNTGTQQGIVIHSPSAMSREEIEEAQQEMAQVESSQDVNKELDDLRNKVEKQLFSLENFLRASKVKLKKRDIFDTEQALKRGRMALVKRADAQSLSELTRYLVDRQALLREQAEAGESGVEKAVTLGESED